MDRKISNWMENLLAGAVLSFLVSFHVALIMQIVSLLRNLVINNWNLYGLLFFDINVILFILVLELAIFISIFAIYKKKLSLSFC